jgi:hypothetical protein
MQGFTEKEFEQIIEELFDEKGARFDTMFESAQALLTASIARWCYADSLLKGKGYEDDIFSVSMDKIIKKCVTHFFLKNGPEGELNRDFEGFKNWMFTVAKNTKKDFARKEYIKVSSERGFYEEEEDMISAGDYETSPHIYDNLEISFRIVVNSDSSVYKILTWLAQSVILVTFDVSNSESKALVVKNFENLSLFKMRNVIFKASERVPWMRFSEAQIKKINTALKKEYGDGRVLGQVTYGEFFMKKGGAATVSDWVNRMNNLIKREYINETSDN